MIQLDQSVVIQGLLRKQAEMFGLRKLSRPSNPNQLALPYHPKSGQLFDHRTCKKHFVRCPTSIADRLNAAQQPAGTARLSGEIVLGGFAA